MAPLRLRAVRERARFERSVVPIFQEQLEKGEALTITHPDMTRFFMTIPEAAWLILDAGALGQSGDLFVHDMGEPVYAGEDIERTPNDKVFRAVAGPPSLSVRDDARQLLALATGEDEVALRQALLDYVGGAEERQTAGAHAESLMPGFLGPFPVPADQLAGLPGVALQ